MSLTLAIPTWKNQNQLIDALVSLVRNTDWSGRILVVNNGEPGLYETVQAAVPHEVDWIDAGRNLGWMGGINLALEHVKTPFFTMCNDDVLWPPGATQWWSNTLRWFDKTDVGGVGPSSNYVSGAQNIRHYSGAPVITVPYLIGFCATYRTEQLKAMGGLDESLPGGDDLDLSIRMRGAGLNLVADRRNFLYHYGAQTGQRVHPGQWDSQEHQAATYNALIHKHGLRAWFELVNTEGVGMPTDEDYVATTRRGMVACQDSLEGLYARARQTPSDINTHLDTLYRYASMCKSVVETGTDDCTSTAALLAAQPATLDCFDINRTPEVDDIERHAGATKFTFHKQSVLEADGSFPFADMWFCDDLHTYTHVRSELALHAHKIKRYIAFHDVAIFGDRDQDGQGPGIWRAIKEYMRDRPEWALVYYTENRNGLAVFARIQ